MPSTFAKAVDSFRTTTTGRSVGSGTLSLASGTGVKLGTLPNYRIFRITVVSNPDEQILTILEATGISGDILTGVSVCSGYNDVTIPGNAFIDIRVCAEDISELQDALNAVESGGAVGGQGDLQYNDGSGGFAAGGMTWDGSTLTVNGSLAADIHMSVGQTGVDGGSNYFIFYQDNNTLAQDSNFKYSSLDTNVIIGQSNHQGKVTIHADNNYGNTGLVLFNHSKSTVACLTGDDTWGLFVCDANGQPTTVTCCQMQIQAIYTGSTPIAIQLPVGQTVDAFQVLAPDGTTVIAAIDKSGTYICPGIINAAADDNAAAAAGVPLYGFYQTNGNIRIRLT